MAKYIIRDVIPCWVTYLYEVEAESEADAKEKFMESPECIGHEVGDSIEFLNDEYRTEIKAAPPPPQPEENEDG